jgi:flagellar basal-body rod modification protein FlgD
MTTQSIENSFYVDTPKAKPKSQLDMETFMRLLTVQLSTQNPLEPMNDRDFFAQMAQLGTVQGMDNLNKSMDVSRVQSMMGKLVTAVRPDGTGSVTGIVKSLDTRNGETYIGIQEPNGGVVQVKPDAIQSVSYGNDISTAAGMMGKKVTGYIEKTVNGQPTVVEFSGTVQSVQLKNGQYWLNVKNDKGETVPMLMDAVTKVEA